MDSGHEEKVIRSLPLIQNNRWRCPFCSTPLRPVYAKCCFDSKGKRRYVLRKVSFCRTCDLHFATRALVSDLNSFGEEKKIGKVRTFSISQMTAEEIREVAYGSIKDINIWERIRQKQNPDDTADNPNPSNGQKKETPASRSVNENQSTQGLSKPHHNFYDINEKDIFKQYGVPRSTRGIINYTDKSGKNEENIVLVDDADDQDSIHNIFWSEREICRVFTDAIARMKHDVNYRGLWYHINWYAGSKLRKQILARREGYRRFKEIDNNIKPVDIHIYRGKRLCKKHLTEVEILAVYVYGMQTREAHPIDVYFCPVCKEYFVNYEVYLDFCKRYGLPPFRLHDDQDEGSEGSDYYDRLRDHSELNLYGYNVNEKNCLTVLQRQKLLADLIDSGLMTQAQICGFLEDIMRMHRKNPNSTTAMEKWKADLAFVQDHKMDSTHVVWGKFVPAAGKRFVPF